MGNLYTRLFNKAKDIYISNEQKPLRPYPVWNLKESNLFRIIGESRCNHEYGFELLGCNSMSAFTWLKKSAWPAHRFNAWKKPQESAVFQLVTLRRALKMYRAIDSSIKLSRNKKTWRKPRNSLETAIDQRHKLFRYEIGTCTEKRVIRTMMYNEELITFENLGKLWGLCAIALSLAPNAADVCSHSVLSFCKAIRFCEPLNHMRMLSQSWNILFSLVMYVAFARSLVHSELVHETTYNSVE